MKPEEKHKQRQERLKPALTHFSHGLKQLLFHRKLSYPKQ